MNTYPAEDSPDQENVQPHLVLAPSYKDPVTGALYVHQDLKQVVAPWAEEEHRDTHRTAIKADEKFGDLESFAAYLNRYARLEDTLITWNSKGLSAVLDYHAEKPNGDDNRLSNLTQWRASYPFVATPNWAAWSTIATGQAIDHQKAVEFLDDHLTDIEHSQQLTLLNVLRKLRASSSQQADTELRADGTAAVTFKKDDRVVADGGVDLPPEFEIVIPIMRGHTDGAGRHIAYKLVVKLRASILQGHLALRFSIPTSEEVLEQVYGDMIAAARTKLPDETPIYRTQG